MDSDGLCGSSWGLEGLRWGRMGTLRFRARDVHDVKSGGR